MTTFFKIKLVADEGYSFPVLFESSDLGLEGVAFVRGYLGVNLPLEKIHPQTVDMGVHMLDVELTEKQAVSMENWFWSSNEKTLNVGYQEINQFYNRTVKSLKDDDGEVVEAWVSYSLDKERLIRYILLNYYNSEIEE